MKNFLRKREKKQGYKSPYIVIGLGGTGAKIVNEMAKWLKDIEIVSIITNEADKIWITEKNVHILPIAEKGWGGLAGDVPELDERVAVQKIKAHLGDMAQEKRIAFFIGSVSGSTFTSLCPILGEELYNTWGIHGFTLCSMPLENAGYDEWRNALYYISKIKSSDSEGVLTSTFFDLQGFPTATRGMLSSNISDISRPITNLINALKSGVFEEMDIVTLFGKKNKGASFFYREMASVSESRYCELIAQELKRNTMAGVPAGNDFVSIFSVPDSWKNIPVKEDVCDAIIDTHERANIIKFSVRYGSEFYTHFIWASIDIGTLYNHIIEKISPFGLKTLVDDIMKEYNLPITLSESLEKGVNSVLHFVENVKIPKK